MNIITGKVVVNKRGRSRGEWVVDIYLGVPSHGMGGGGWPYYDKRGGGGRLAMARMRTPIVN